MTTYEEGSGVLVVRRKVRTGFLRLMAWLSAFIVIGAILMAVAKVVSPQSNDPAGDSMPWYAIVLSLLFGASWLAFYLRAFKAVEVRLDRNAGKITAVWDKTVSGRTERSVPLAAVRGVRTVGSQTRRDLVRVGLRIEGEPDLTLLGEGAFAPVRDEARQLATRLAAFLQVPIEGT